MFAGRKLQVVLHEANGRETKSLLGVIEPDHRAAIKRRQMKDEFIAGALIGEDLFCAKKRKKGMSCVCISGDGDARRGFWRGLHVVMRNDSGKVGEENAGLAIHGSDVRDHERRGFDAT